MKAKWILQHGCRSSINYKHTPRLYRSHHSNWLRNRKKIVISAAMLKVWHTLYLSESRILTVHTYILYRNTQFLKLVPWQHDYCISWIYFIYIVKHVVLFTSEQKIASHLFFLLMLQLHHTTMNDREEEKNNTFLVAGIGLPHPWLWIH